MKKPSVKATCLFALLASLALWQRADAYVEAPYSLGQTINESTNVLLVEVTRVNKEKNLIIFKKVRDIKGKHEGAELKHNIGKNGFHEREWQNVIKWAEAGKKAVIFHNGGASETCIGDYWYQCQAEGEWWSMSHAEPFMLRTFCGAVDKLADTVADVLAGKEVIVPCMADVNKETLHERKGKMQMLRASLKRATYNAKRDFLGWGIDPADIQEFKTTILLPESTASWKFLPEPEAKELGNRWREVKFEDKGWRTGQAPIGYGEDEIAKRKGTLVKEEGVSFLFRREFEVPADLLKKKGVIFTLSVASDDHAKVWLNGDLADADPEDDHEFAYWNREVEIDPKLLRPGRNIVAAFVKNHKGSSDIYLDMEISAQSPLPKKGANPKEKAAAAWVEKFGRTAVRAKDRPGEPVVEVSLAGLKNLTDSDLALLRDFQCLESLRLSFTPIGDAGLENLHDLTELRSLNLYGTQVTDQGLERLLGLGRLEVLLLAKTKVTSKGLALLKHWPNLRILNLSDLALTEESLAHLSALPNLEELYLTGTPVKDNGLDHLLQCRKLKKLMLAETQIGDDGLKRLKDMPSLEFLELIQTHVTDKGLVHLNDMKGLQCVHLEQTAVSDNALKELRKTLPKLKIDRK